MNVVVLNCGSSSLKFQVIETSAEQIAADADRRLAWGSVERLGGQALVNLQREGHPPYKEALPVRDHAEAIQTLARLVVEYTELKSVTTIGGIGHRVVHGGERFKASVRITPEVIDGIEDCVDLAPLHNPANLKGIRAAQKLFGEGLPQVAVFDTAFHATMPETAFLYGIPYPLYRRHKIRRYGFHGTSHRYVTYRYRRLHGLEREAVNIVSLHLGNGCSACAIKGGNSVDTSMGMTPLEGLLMGTRAGDLDASVFEYLMQTEGLSAQEVDSLLNKSSGLLGLSGLSGDMRDLLAERSENQDRRASLAIDIFCQRVKKYIGAYLAVLNGADALVFTGGIGQNAWEVREQICSGLDFLGIRLDPEKNRSITGDQEGRISADGYGLPVWTIPTNEELLIARDTVRAVV